MKTHLKIGIMLYLILSLISCTGVEREAYTEYEISNSSGHNVKMFVANFSYDRSSKDSIFNIIDNRAITLKNDENGEYYNPFIHSDSISICFDDTDCISYLISDTSSRNPLHDKNYKIEEISKDRFFTHLKYKYVITKDEYNQVTN